MLFFRVNTTAVESWRLGQTEVRSLSLPLSPCESEGGQAASHFACLCLDLAVQLFREKAAIWMQLPAGGGITAAKDAYGCTSTFLDLPSLRKEGEPLVHFSRVDHSGIIHPQTNTADARNPQKSPCLSFSVSEFCFVCLAVIPPPSFFCFASPHSHRRRCFKFNPIFTPNFLLITFL